MSHTYKIAIVGASTLRGKELKEALSESSFAASTFTLLDADDSLGQLDAIGDEITVLQAIDADSFNQVDFTFFTGPEALTLKHWHQALRSGSSVIDLSGALDTQPGVLVHTGWLQSIFPDKTNPSLTTPAIVPAHPAALALALLTAGIQQAAPIRYAAATVLEPASEYGRAGMDELHQQSISLLSFQSMPRAIYDAQAAYNVLGAFGEAAPIALSIAEQRIRRHYTALASGHLPHLSVQLIHAPVFHGYGFSVFIELEHPVSLSTLEESLNSPHIDLVLEDSDTPSNLAATGQNDVVVRLRPDDASSNNEVQRLWLWAACDNLRLSAQNAVDSAQALRPLRPQGKIQ